ncbi:hypothetical protein PIB30_031957 [Stylosanthes scabra]|uniref:BHLH domain-containing protein n=1 Tax=Stylosanthes scabra TaxID=79078 RepID=A0ABU6RCB1_9FABA|nr:hypothetical protein [Stylosanthes scabra]
MGKIKVEESNLRMLRYRFQDGERKHPFPTGSRNGEAAAAVTGASTKHVQKQLNMMFEFSRRRSRINEKMKALGNLIPNANKVLMLIPKLTGYTGADSYKYHFKMEERSS